MLDTCTCSHLTNATASVGEMSCTNDETRYCETNQECYATVAFNYGQWDVGCRVVSWKIDRIKNSTKIWVN